MPADRTPTLSALCLIAVIVLESATATSFGLGTAGADTEKLENFVKKDGKRFKQALKLLNDPGKSASWAPAYHFNPDTGRIVPDRKITMDEFAAKYHESATKYNEAVQEIGTQATGTITSPERALKGVELLMSAAEMNPYLPPLWTNMAIIAQQSMKVKSGTIFAERAVAAALSLPDLGVGDLPFTLEKTPQVLAMLARLYEAQLQIARGNEGETKATMLLGSKTASVMYWANQMGALDSDMKQRMAEYIEDYRPELLTGKAQKAPPKPQKGGTLTGRERKDRREEARKKRPPPEEEEEEGEEGDDGEDDDDDEGQDTTGEDEGRYEKEIVLEIDKDGNEIEVEYTYELIDDDDDYADDDSGANA